MHYYGQIDGILNGGYEIVGVLGCQQAGHILDAYGAYAHACHFLYQLYVVVQGVDGADGVGDGAGSHCSGLDGLFDGYLEVINVVESVEYPDDVYAVLYRLPYEAADDVVRIVSIAEDILSAEKHLKLGVRHAFADLSESFPRILVEEPQADIECRSAPDLAGIVACLVHFGKDRLELFERETGSNERLVCVTQYCFGELDH